MLGLVAVVVLLLALASGGAAHVLFVALFIGIVFVGFWVVVLRMMIGFGRWLMHMPPDRPAQARTLRASSQRSLPHGRICPDPRCGEVNLSEARYCSRCGRSLSQAA